MKYEYFSIVYKDGQIICERRLDSFWDGVALHGCEREHHMMCMLQWEDRAVRGLLNSGFSLE